MLWEDFVGSGDVESALTCSIRCQFLVLGVDEAEEEADGHGSHSGPFDPIEHEVEFSEIERCDNLAVERDSLIDLVAQSLWDERFMALRMQGVQVGTRLAADNQGVPEPLGRDQRRRRAGAREECIRGHRGAVDDLLGRPAEFSESVDDRPTGIVGS